MAQRILHTTFAPEWYPNDGVVIPERRGIFGVTFTLEGERQIKAAIDREQGESGPDEEDAEDDDAWRRSKMDQIMRWSAVHIFAERQLRKHYANVPSVHDDIYVHMANELGIDWRRFPHNVRKLPIDGFLPIAKKTLGQFELAANQTRWHIQEKKLSRAWDQWVEGKCARRECPENSHRRCAAAYDQPNFWGIAKALDREQREGSELLSKLDVIPRGKAVKIANDALARIGVATKSPSQPKKAS